MKNCTLRLSRGSGFSSPFPRIRLTGRKLLLRSAIYYLAVDYRIPDAIWSRARRGGSSRGRIQPNNAQIQRMPVGLTSTVALERHVQCVREINSLLLT